MVRLQGNHLPELGIRRLVIGLLLVAFLLPLHSARAADASPREFTIEWIKPAPQGSRIDISFSAPIPIKLLKRHLTVLPRIRLDWSKSKFVGSNVLRLSGAFKPGQRHVLALPSDFKALGRIYKTGQTAFTMPDLPPSIKFVDHGSVIELKSPQRLHLKATNLTNLRLKGLTFPPLMLPLAYAAGPKADLTKIRTEMDRAARLLAPKLAEIRGMNRFSGEINTLQKLFMVNPGLNKPRAYSLPLTFRNKADRGSLILLRAEQDSKNVRAAGSEPRILRITDLGLTYKLAQDDLLVWVTSLATGLPEEDVSLIGFTSKMEVVPLGRTDHRGILLYQTSELKGLSWPSPDKAEVVSTQVRPGSITLVAAVSENDVSFIEIKPQGNIKPQEVKQVRRDKMKRLPLRGHVFTERGAYKPGEKVFFKGTVRAYEDGSIKAPAQGECLVTISDSKDRQIYKKKLTLSEFGTAAGELLLGRHAPLGTYTLTLKYGPKSETSRTFQVQEFRPPRHYAEIFFEQTSRDEKNYSGQLVTRKMVQIKVNGVYYAGGPVKNGRIRYKISKTQTNFSVLGHEEYSFGFGSGSTTSLIESGEAVLDEKGVLNLEFPLTEDVLTGRRGLKISATVVDFDGRASASSKTFQIEPPFLVGLGPHPDSVVAGSGQRIKILVLDKEFDSIRNGVLKAKVLQSSGAYVRKRNAEGDVYWSYDSMWKQVWSSDLELSGGESEFNFDFPWGGEYLVAVSYQGPDGREYTSATPFNVVGDFHWDVYWNRDKPFESLALSADKKVYLPGQKARIFFQPRRPVSRYLVTLEQAGIRHSMVVEGQPGAQSIEFEIDEGYAPNVYVSVLGLSPRGSFPSMPDHYDSQAPGFQFGTINLSVRAEDRKIDLALANGAQELKAEPGAEVTFSLTASTGNSPGGPVELAVGVVDESVLALTGYKTPELSGLNLFDLPLAVFTGELRHLMAHQTPFKEVTNRPLTGGGGAGGAEALEAKIRRDFSPVAYFNPSLRTDERGQAQISFTLPDTMTKYRVFVVACDQGSAYGSSAWPLTAVKDFYVEPGLPRFLNAGDKFSFNLKGFNKSKQQGGFSAVLNSSDNLLLKGSEKSLVIKSENSTMARITGQALKTGNAEAGFRAELQREGKVPLKDSIRISLPIKSGYVQDRLSRFGSLAGKTEARLDLSDSAKKLDWSGITEDELRLTLSISGSPFLATTQAFKYLLRYPYGCVEQTSSTIMPMAALGTLIRQGLIPGIKAEDTKKYLESGIDRLAAMQTWSGGFGYWPGNRQPHLWGSAYAVAALTQAKLSGVKVPEEVLKKGLKYLSGRIKKSRGTQAFRAMSLYLLALNGKLQPQLARPMMIALPKLSREARLYMVLAADRANLLDKELLLRLARETLALPRGRDDQDEFRAWYREPAIALLVAASILPDDPLAGEAAEEVLGGLGQSGGWSSTSDTGWALVALGEYFKGRKFGTEEVPVKITQSNGQVETVTIKPGVTTTLELNPKAFMASPEVTIEPAADQALVFQLALAYPRLDLAREGTAAGFNVVKTIENTDGGKKIKVGDLVKVRVRLETGQSLVRYVALDDPLPAGLVAVNTALRSEEPVGGGSLGRSSEFEYRHRNDDGSYNFAPHFFEIRDDRVRAFRNTLWSGVYEFSYYARAVCAGEFVLPQTKVELMYRPDIRGLTKMSRVIIEE